MRRLLHRLRRDERGFSLPELVVTMAIGTIVIAAALGLLKFTMKRANDVNTRIDANQRGRLALDVVTRQLRSQVCLNPATKPLVVAKANELTFYGDLRNNAAGLTPVAQKRTVKLDTATSTLVELVSTGTETADGVYSWSTPNSRTLLTDVTQDGSTPLFRYYAFNTRPSRPCSTPVTPATGSSLSQNGHGPDREDRGPVQGQPVDHRRVREVGRRPVGRHLLATGQPQPSQDHVGAQAGVHVMRARPSLRDERGFSMFLVIMVLLACSLFVAGAYAAAHGDLPMSGDSKDRKVTYAAAEAGLNFYGFHLNQDNDYWLKCTAVEAPNGTEKSPVSQAWKTGTADPRDWRNVPGSDAQYTVELLPAKNAPTGKCDVGKANSMLDPVTGTFRVRITGRPYALSKQRRSIVATYRRVGFLDFLYFTQYETMDPYAYKASSRDWAIANCGDKPRASRSSSCTEIVFIEGDGVAGPFHSNDSILTCGKPMFGRVGYEDRLTVSAPAPGYIPYGNCASTPPTFNNDFAAGVDSVNMPPSNTKLYDVTLAENRFIGKTYITFTASSTKMTVTNSYLGWTNKQVDLPDNGVIYVSNNTAGACDQPPPTEATYTESKNCGNLYVKGIYNANMTIAAQNDIIVNGNLTQVRRRGAGPRGQQLRPRLPPRVQLRERHGRAEQRHDRRGDPHAAALVHGRQPRLRRPARQPQRQRRDRAEVPRRGRHLRHRLRRRPRRELRLQEGLQVRRPPALPHAAVLPAARELGLERHPLARADPGALAPRALRPAVPCDPAPAGSLSLPGWTKCRLEQGLSRHAGCRYTESQNQGVKSKSSVRARRKTTGLPDGVTPGCHRRW